MGGGHEQCGVAPPGQARSDGTSAINWLTSVDAALNRLHHSASPVVAISCRGPPSVEDRRPDSSLTRERRGIAERRAFPTPEGAAGSRRPMGRLSESHSLVPCGLPQCYSYIEQRVTALFWSCLGTSTSRPERAHGQRR